MVSASVFAFALSCGVVGDILKFAACVCSRPKYAATVRLDLYEDVTNTTGSVHPPSTLDEILASGRYFVRPSYAHGFDAYSQDEFGENFRPKFKAIKASP